MRDKLAHMPGLAPHPVIGTPEHDQLQRELEFAIEDQGNTREQCAAVILRFMIGRGLWPLGTRVKVTKKYKVKATFPSAS